MLRAVLQRAGWLGLGTAIGQGAILAATPWLARIYGPESYGVLALLITATNISSAIGCARFDLAIPSADSGDVTPLLRLSTLVAASMAILAGVAAVVAERGFDTPDAVQPILEEPLLLAGCVFLGATFQAASAGLLRRQQVGLLAALRAGQGLVFVGVAVSPLGLLWAQVISCLPGFIIVVVLLVKVRRGRTVATVAAKYKSFALLGLPGATLDVVGYSLFIWIVTSAYGAAATGELSQVQRIVGAPLMLASISLGQVLLNETGRMKSDPRAVRDLFSRLMLLMGGAAGALLLALVIVGEPVLALLLGERWQVDTLTIMTVSFAVCVRAIVSPTSSILATYRRLDVALCWQASYFVSAALLFSLWSGWLPLSQFLILYALHEAAAYSIYYLLISRVLRKS